MKTHRYALVGLYLFVFLTGFFLVQMFGPQPRVILHCAVDDWIPFRSSFVLAYFLWYAWVPVFLLYFMVRERAAYLRLCFVMFVGATFCLLVYVLLPNGLQLREEITGSGFCDQIVRFLRSVDPPRNVCPSIHVSSTVAIHLVLCRSQTFRDSRRMRLLSLAVTLLICVSTMFIKQHSLIDVVCGWALSVLLARLSDRLPVFEN